MLNQKLRAAREKKHWSMETAAEQIGVSKTSIARWENGEQKPRGASLDLVCTAYGMSAEELGLANDGEESFSSTSTMVQDQITMRLSVEQATQLSLILETEYNNMPHFDSSRRKALEQLCKVIGMTAIVPQIETNTDAWERLFQAPSKPSSMNEETLDHFQKLLEGCWGLTNNGEMDIAHQTLTTFLPQIMHIAPHQPEATALVAHGLRLQSILSAHRLRVFDMVPLCQKAVKYARISDNYDTLSASLDGLAIAYKYTHQQKDALKTYQEAIYYGSQASPLVRSRLYAASAAMFAQQGRMQEADFYMHLAYESFPDNPEGEPNFLSADNGTFILAYYEGLMYLAMNKPKEAERAFESHKKRSSVAPIPERNRLETINHRGKAAILLNDLEQYSFCLEEGIKGAVAIQSKKRFDEALTVFHQDMPQGWSKEPHIKHIAERFQIEK